MQKTPHEEVQMSLFSFSGGGLTEPDDEEFDNDYDEDENEEFGGMVMR
jgi:hypothetical protein